MGDDATTTQTWAVGELTVTAVVESEIGGIPPQMFFPEATAEDVRAHGWAAGTYADEAGHIAMRVQAFVIDDGSRRVLVDPCVGNHKNRSMPFWHQQEYPFLERLVSAGYPPDTIDLVVHTHLHADHVGWDTVLEDDRWTPTFRHARHLYVGEELDHWTLPAQRQEEDVFADSIEPIFSAGLADLVGDGDDLGGGLRLTPTRGHTPGHTSLLITSGNAEAVITGDFMHHPVQCSEPDWREIADWDPAMAVATRRDALACYAGDGRLVFGAHFPYHPVGHVRAHGDVWRFEPVDGRRS